MKLSAIPHDATAEAAINDPNALLTLYAPDGEAIQVQASKEAAWLTRGFSRTQADPETTLAALELALKEAPKAVRAYVKGVLHDGQIDPADTAAQATAYTALELVTQLWGQLVADLHRRYPMRQGEAVTLTRDGASMTVDPGQAEAYIEEGWSR